MLATTLRLIAFVAIAYGLICGLLFMVQERLIFFPERDPPGTAYVFGIPAEEVWLPVGGATLYALWFQLAGPRGVILYLHGNAGSLRSWGAVAPDLVARGYDLLIFDRSCSNIRCVPTAGSASYAVRWSSSTGPPTR